ELLAIKVFLDDDGVGDPDDDTTQVAVFHLGGQQVRARLFERGGDGDAVIDVFGPRLQVQVPAGGFFAEVLLLLLLHQHVSNVAEIDLVPVYLIRAALQIGLDVGEQLLDVDGERFEGDLVAVAEAEIDGRLSAGGLVAQGLEAAPIADDLIEAPLPPGAGPRV